MNNLELGHLQSWIGRSEQRVDFVASAPLAALAATLDRDEAEPQPGSDASPLAHWLLFHPLARQSRLGRDGNPECGALLPPVPLPRRIWAGGRLEFHHPLRIGDEVMRTSRIAKVQTKVGSTGPLVFVTVRHELNNARGMAITEEQDILCRERPTGDARSLGVQRPQEQPDFSLVVVPNAVLLFRYCALTFNGHRIHYDRSYAAEVEGCPGLVVPGALVATLLLDGLRRSRPDSTLKRFAFTATGPLFDLHPFKVCGRGVNSRTTQLWAQDHEGFVAMRAVAEFS